MDEKKLPELSDAEMDEILSKAPPTISEAFLQMMKDDIAADLAAIENPPDEFARIKAEDKARGEAVDQARRERGQRERAVAEKRRIEGYRGVGRPTPVEDRPTERDLGPSALLSQPNQALPRPSGEDRGICPDPDDSLFGDLKDMLDLIGRSKPRSRMATGEFVDYKFDVDAWRLEEWKPQIALWESQFTAETEPPAKFAGDSKARLLYLYLNDVPKRKPTVLPVLIALLERSPDDFTAFEVSHQQLAADTRICVRSVGHSDPLPSGGRGAPGAREGEVDSKVEEPSLVRPGTTLEARHKQSLLVIMDTGKVCREYRREKDRNNTTARILQAKFACVSWAVEFLTYLHPGS